MKSQPGKRRSPVLSSAMLDEMIEEATVDAYGSSEQVTGFHAMLDAHLAVPFKTKVLDVEVTVTRVDITSDERIVAVCVRGRARQAIPILDLPLPDPRPSGAEWIEAYRRWAHRQW
jgi:hypothetical protein